MKIYLAPLVNEFDNVKQYTITIPTGKGFSIKSIYPNLHQIVFTCSIKFKLENIPYDASSTFIILNNRKY